MRLADVRVAGRGVARDAAAAVRSYGELCANDSEPACYRLAVPRGAAGDTAARTRACARGNRAACTRLGAAYAAELYRRACNAGNSVACSELRSQRR